MHPQFLHTLEHARDRVLHRQLEAVDMTEQPGQDGRTDLRERASTAARSEREPVPQRACEPGVEQMLRRTGIGEALAEGLEV